MAGVEGNAAPETPVGETLLVSTVAEAEVVVEVSCATAAAKELTQG